jgi:8-amino-7-oxononanoate synthase
MTIESFINKNIDNLKNKNLFRQIKTYDRLEDSVLLEDEAKLISFACNDYLGLVRDKRLINSAIEATQKFGVGAGASRLVSGNSSLYDKLEKKLAKHYKRQDACVFGSGYLTNLGVITALVSEVDLVVIDKLSHSCIIEGAKLSGALLKRFSHNSLVHLEEILSKYRKDYNKCLVVTESVFSMDGDLAPIGQIAEICKKYDSWLLYDNAHYLGSDKLTNYENSIVMGTLSKAYGAYGGFVAADKNLCDYLKSASKMLMFTTGLPPAMLSAAFMAIEISDDEHWRAEKAIENAKYFMSQLKKSQNNSNDWSKKLIDSQSQIVALVVGEESLAIDLSKYLKENGYLVSAIRPPTVPKGTSRLRFSFSALHSKENINNIVNLLSNYEFKV